MAKVLALGEIMLRLSVGGGVRLSDASAFAANYGGAEANVAISLAQFGHDAAFASKVPVNPLGDGAVKHLHRFGIDCSQVLRGGARLGTYYIEEGVGARGSQATYDRVGSAFAEITECEWDLDELFNDVDLMHVSGVCPALSPAWRELTLGLVHEAAMRGVQVSYDVNFRGKLWTWDECMAAFRAILPYVSVLSAGIGDVQSVLELERTAWTEEALAAAYEQMFAAAPRLEAVYSTRRVVHSSSSNDLTGYLMMRDGELVYSATHHIEPIVDRVGGGDAFAGGVLHGLLSGWDAQRTIEFGCAAGALKHTVAGDCNRFIAAEVEEFLRSGADVAR